MSAYSLTIQRSAPPSLSRGNKTGATLTLARTPNRSLSRGIQTRAAFTLARGGYPKVTGILFLLPPYTSWVAEVPTHHTPVDPFSILNDRFLYKQQMGCRSYYPSNESAFRKSSRRDDFTAPSFLSAPTGALKALYICMQEESRAVRLFGPFFEFLFKFLRSCKHETSGTQSNPRSPFRLCCCRHHFHLGVGDHLRRRLCSSHMPRLAAKSTGGLYLIPPPVCSCAMVSFPTAGMLHHRKRKQAVLILCLQELFLALSRQNFTPRLGIERTA